MDHLGSFPVVLLHPPKINVLPSTMSVSYNLPTNAEYMLKPCNNPFLRAYMAASCLRYVPLGHDLLTFAIEAQAVNLKGTFLKRYKENLDVINIIMESFMWKKKMNVVV